MSSLYRIVIEIESDTNKDAAIGEYARELHAGALWQGRAASTKLIAVFSDARTAGNILWSAP